MAWHKVAKTADFADGRAQLIEIGASKIALFRAEGVFFALDNACPHRGGPLVEGHVEGKTVACPWHAWQFDLKTGDCLTNSQAKQRMSRVKVEAGDVFIEI